jgi:diadenosine tetraphosphatase ApaH/serine/threonine PP2A family protein phosphatase
MIVRERRMKLALLSDIHSNEAALLAVLEHIAGGEPVDAFLVLGDIVGYGPDPNEVISCLSGRQVHAVAGNHDLAVTGKISVDLFNAAAAEACLWTAKELTIASSAFLRSLPQLDTVEGFTLAHGSPRDPTWEYLLSPADAGASFRVMQTPSAVVGHSHIPLLFREVSGERCTMELLQDEVNLKSVQRVIINPGSVGQPRDGDPRASYARLDTETGVLQHFRVPYDIARTQDRMRKARLPAWLIERLAVGR